MRIRNGPALLMCITVLAAGCGSKLSSSAGPDQTRGHAVPAGAIGAPGAASQAATSAGPSPSQTVRTYLELIDRGDIDGALALRPVDQRPPSGSQVSKADLEGGKLDAYMQVYIFAGVLHDVGGIKSVDILKEEIGANSARVEAKLSYRKAMDERISCELIMEADGWKIRDFGGDR